MGVDVKEICAIKWAESLKAASGKTSFVPFGSFLTFSILHFFIDLLDPTSSPSPTSLLQVVDNLKSSFPLGFECVFMKYIC